MVSRLGHFVMVAVVGKFAMEIAIQKAKETGVGWVVARNSNHYGIAGFYAMMASDIGMIGMSMTNTSPGNPPPLPRTHTHTRTTTTTTTTTTYFFL